MVKKITRVVVFGAGGRVGRLVVASLVDKGYKVRGFMHRTHLAQDGVEVMTGDINDAAAVDKAVDDMDAVISVVSHTRRAPANMQTEGMKMINKAMVRNNIRRIISLTGSGVRQADDKTTFIDRLLILVLAIINKPRLDDGRFHAEFLRETNLDYTVVRVAKLTNGLPTDSWKLTTNGPSKALVSRADTAAAIVKTLDENLFVREMPLISAR